MYKKIPLTSGKFAIVDREDYLLLNRWKWHLHGKRYAARQYRIPNVNGGEGKRSLVLMHRLINATPDGFDTDHINGNGLDNRRENLRTCSRKENLRNCKTTKTFKGKKCRSRFKGVVPQQYATKSGVKTRYVSKITINGVLINLGCHDYEIEAAIAYNEIAKGEHGEYANLNPIPKKAYDITNQIYKKIKEIMILEATRNDICETT